MSDTKVIDHAQSVADRCEVIDTINLIGLSADLRDWTRCRSQFADRVIVDYSSLIGGEAEILGADALIERWKAFFSATFAHTQHLITNHKVDLEQSSANCMSQFVAHHICQGKNDRWTVAGLYSHKLSKNNDRWLVTAMTMKLGWEEGQRPF